MHKLTSIELRRCETVLRYLNAFDPKSRECSAIATWIKKYGDGKLGIEIPKEFKAYESAFEYQGEGKADEIEASFFSTLGMRSHKLSPEQLAEREERTNAVKVFLQEAIDYAYEQGEPEPTALEKNIDKLGEILGLDATDKNLIMFLADFANMAKLFETTRFDYNEDDQYYEYLGKMIGTDEETVRQKLSNDHALRAACLIEYTPYSWGEKNREAFSRTPSNAYSIDMIFLGVMKAGEQSVDTIIEKLMGESPKTDLDLSNYGFMEEAVNNFMEVIRGALQAKDEVGRTALLYGPPGVGKTELTAAIGKAIGVPVILVGNNTNNNAFVGEDKEPDRKDRMRALKRANYLAKAIGKEMLFVFDEAEDICIDITDDSQQGADKSSKGHFNHLLDTLYPVTIFITNKMDKFDKAYVRRMNPQLHIPQAPSYIQTNIILDNCKKRGLDITRNQASSLTKHVSWLSPGDISRCVRAVGWRQDVIGNNAAIVRALEQNFLETSKAKNSGIPPVPVSKTKKPSFDFKMVRVSDTFEAETNELIETISETGLQGLTMLLNGPNGSCRRQYFNWLAKQVGHGSMQASYGRLLNPMNGEYSDQALAALLQEAETEQAMLLITGGSPILEFGANHSFFNRAREYPYSVSVMVDQSYAEPAPATSRSTTTKSMEDPQLAQKFSEIKMIQELLQPEIDAFIAKLNLGDKSASPSQACNEFTFIHNFKPLREDGIRAAFNAYLGMQAPEAAFGLRTLVPYDFELVARKARFVQCLANDPEAALAELYRMKGRTVPTPKVETEEQKFRKAIEGLPKDGLSQARPN